MINKGCKRGSTRWVGHQTALAEPVWKKGRLSWHGPVSGTGKIDETRKLDGRGLVRRINFNQKKVREYLSLDM